MIDVEGIRLFAITDVQTYPDLVQVARRLCAAARPGTVAVVLRDRQVPLRRRFELAQFLRRATSDLDQLLFISDRPDLARSVEADGVHLPANGLLPSDCRKIWDGAMSRSGHGLIDLEDQDWDELDAVFVSPVMAERKGRDPIGVEGLKEQAARITARSAHVGTYALGGINHENARDCVFAGVRGVAAIGACWRVDEGQKLVEALGIGR